MSTSSSEGRPPAARRPSVPVSPRVDAIAPLSNEESVESVDLDPVRDAEEIAAVSHTYWHMKERQWNRTITTTFTNSNRTINYIYSILMTAIFVFYVAFGIAYHHHYLKYIVEYLLVFLLFLSVLFLGPRIQMTWRIILTEVYIELTIFFLCNWYYQPGYYIPYRLLHPVSISLFRSCRFVFLMCFF